MQRLKCILFVATAFADASSVCDSSSRHDLPAGQRCSSSETPNAHLGLVQRHATHVDPTREAGTKPWLDKAEKPKAWLDKADKPKPWLDKAEKPKAWLDKADKPKPWLDKVVDSSDQSGHNAGKSCGLIANPPHDRTTNCPNSAWIDEMVTAEIPPGRGKVFVSIGCNKGNDALAWLDRFDLSENREWSTQKWIEQARASGATNFACEPSVPAKFAYASDQVKLVAAREEEQKNLPRSICVEPMASNIHLLQNISKTLGVPEQSFEIVQAAAGAESGKFVDFPGDDEPVGTENIGMHDDDQSLRQHQRQRVPLITVDELVASRNLGLVDVLSIDTEGGDADVLKGAAATLASVRYLEFEVHRDLAQTSWSRVTLRSVIDDLNTKDFDCFWAGNNGKLVNVLECWQEGYESGGWGNVVCAKRGDVWNSVLQRYAMA